MESDGLESGKSVWNYIFVTLYVVDLLHKLCDKTDVAQPSVPVLVGFDRKHVRQGFVIREQYCVSTLDEM